MLKFELRKTEDGYQLAGGQLDEPLDYPDPDAIEYATRVVGFLSQKTGGELRVIAADGSLVDTKTFRVTMWPAGTTLGNFQDDGALHAGSRRS